MIDDPRFGKDQLNETVDYLSKQEIGVIISQGLAETYREQPSNPVDYLGKWLLNNTRREAQKVCDDDRKDHVKELIAIYERNLKLAKLEEDDKKKIQKAKDDKEEAFFTKVEKCEDHEDIVQDLCEYLQEYTNSTSVFVSKLVQEKNPIEEDDNDKAHLKEDGALFLDIHHSAPEEFKFLLRKTIGIDEGVVHDVFKEEPQTEPNEVKATEEEAEAEGEEPPEQKPASVDIEEIVREPRIKFFKVPRLGNLFCIRLSYERCLFEQALDEAVKDVYDVENKKRQQEIEKAMFEEQEAKRKEEAEKNETEFEPEEKEWEEIKLKPYETEMVDYAVCLDTMGQDRQFTEAEKEKVFKAIMTFSKVWQEQERRNLEKDVNRRIEKAEEDKTFIEKAKARFEEVSEKWVEQNLEESEENRDEKLKRLEYKKMILNGEVIEIRPESPSETKKEDRRERRKRKEREDKEKEENKDDSKDQAEEEDIDFTEKWKNDLKELTQYRVIKMARVIQTAFYLLKYTREDICEEKTNCLDWKKTKKYLNDDFFKNLKEYQPIGEKKDEYKEYQKLNFLMKYLEEIQLQDIEAYSLALGQLFLFLQLAMKIRKEDVLKRYLNNQRLKEERETAEKLEEERLEERATFLEDERQKWEDEHKKPEPKEGEGEGEDDEEDEEAEGEGKEEKQFDEEATLAKFDKEKPPTEIPPPVVDDIDNDIELTEEDINPPQE
ncbi:unnamed protein product [Moneuplotes crassus]|uniref:Uncharacterized protein n=2 Tax=Euplotes crassus TaxID=5936 RepID=A0AAD2DB48_EUPCR|nr:unnamed protein product [Moneuplotes crassus]